MPDVTLEEWARRLTTVAPDEFRRRLTVELRALALRGEREAKLLAGSRLRVRSGRLRSSIRGDVIAEGEGRLSVRLSAGLERELEYARAQEEGATITPRRGRYLAIPLPGALTPAGVLRSRFVRPGGLRAVASLFAVRRPGRRTLLAEAKGDGILPMFVLHEGPVRIRGRHFLRDGLEAARRQLPDAVRDAVETVVLP